jgi:myosin heavy subunit
MSFDYNKTKQSHNSDSFWTSYSDLFLGLSTIFLLLYVTASLRTGTDAIKAQVDNQKLTMQVEELQSQLKMYEQVKAEYLEKQASKSETQEYEELMDKLTLLKEEAKDEKERLAQQALENENKAAALNKYQQMVRNIINANKVAKTKLIARNDIIGEQDDKIETQKENISTLEDDLEQKKDQIEKNQRQIAQAKKSLAKSKQALLESFKNNEITRQAYEEKVKQVQEQGEKKIQDLQADQKQIQSALAQVSGELKSTQSTLTSKERELAAKAQEAQNLQSKIAGMRSEHEAEKARERAAFDAEMRKTQMDAAERARREGEFRAEAARKEREMEQKIAGLNGRVAGLDGKLKDTEGQLAKAKEEMDARRAIAKEIQKGFAAAGVKGDIDMQTGEVTIDFGDTYFDVDSAKLKHEMKAVIERAMPVYSKSLFGNPKIASKISAVEVVGFASPTYQGRFVDPNSSRPEDKMALKYNMDLSYRRANSIFNHILDSKAPEFAYQKNLMSHMKVSGRSFLEVMKVQTRGPASAAEFCKVHDCKKAQRVIVRFSMDGKK